MRVSISIALHKSRMSRSKRERPKLWLSIIIAGGGVLPSAALNSAAACASWSAVTKDSSGADCSKALGGAALVTGVTGLSQKRHLLPEGCCVNEAGSATI